MEICLSELNVPVPANLTISIMYIEEQLLFEIKNICERNYGKIDAISKTYSFSDISPYYDHEMGKGIKKIIFSFEKLVDRSILADVKNECVEIEKKHSENGSRKINIDPGLLSLENFILATGKNYSHRIYLKNGVFAEVTLMFGKKNVIKELPWTYRDYLFEPARSFLLEVREIYRIKREIILNNYGVKVESDSFSA